MPKTVYLIIVAILLVFSHNTFSKSQPVTCGMHEADLIKNFKYSKSSGKNNALLGQDTMTYVIPVVVHIIHNGGAENINDVGVMTQIDVLNQDYNKMNDTGLVGRSRIRFCLATLDPNGKTTTGINRIQSPFTNLDINDEMATKNLSKWDYKRYLNIWVVKSISRNSDTQFTTAGYSYLPPNILNSSTPDADGVVVAYRFFGRNQAYQTLAEYRLGKTAVHEVGHYLNLMHTWGGDGPNQGGCNDDDGIDDTPLCSMAYYSRRFGIPPRCQKPLQCGFVRLTEDHMDYSIDPCNFLFTKGQIDVMRDALLSYRAGLVSTPNLYAVACRSVQKKYNTNIPDGFSFTPNPAVDYINFYPEFREQKQINVEIFNSLGQRVLYTEFYGITDNKFSLSISDLNPQAYVMIIKYDNQVIKSKLIVSH
ncbi:MAG: M43 family zinc metalloprotease [Bacteroidota bacterium]|nr:M43 family zinc metalloprotease [Bacteroidota bacterium]